MRVTRRSFLVTSGVAATARLILGATDKSRSKTPVLGQGEHQYEAIHGWGEMPRTVGYGNK
jgi:hypothetical protein